ncbi:MAG: PadR family transcriptional regulator [Nitrosarchaeum sp.]|nr:PadR family transcriptional regulator [Nitrosarchaeum sp.]
MAAKPKEPRYMQFKGLLSLLILHELHLKRLCGEDLALKIGRRKGAKLTPGTIYPALKHLRSGKLVASRRFGRRKIYHLTDAGVAELRHHYAAFQSIFQGFKGKIRTPRKKGKKILTKTKTSRQTRTSPAEQRTSAKGSLESPAGKQSQRTRQPQKEKSQPGPSQRTTATL